MAQGFVLERRPSHPQPDRVREPFCFSPLRFFRKGWTAREGCGRAAALGGVWETWLERGSSPELLGHGPSANVIIPLQKARKLSSAAFDVRGR